MNNFVARDLAELGYAARIAPTWFPVRVVPNEFDDGYRRVSLLGVLGDRKLQQFVVSH